MLHFEGGLWKCLKIWAERAIAPSGRNELSWDLREDAKSKANSGSLAYEVSEGSLKVPYSIYQGRLCENLWCLVLWGWSEV